MELEINDIGLGEAPGAAVRGEIDIGTAPGLEETLVETIIDSVGAFVVDLTEVTFLDSTGIHTLQRVRDLLGREDRALAVICPHGPVRRVFELTGSSELFALFASRDEAASALVAAD
jgi:anti-sigma B factor antagonist